MSIFNSKRTNVQKGRQINLKCQNRVLPVKRLLHPSIAWWPTVSSLLIIHHTGLRPSILTNHSAVFLSLPSNHSDDTCKASVNAFNSMSETGRFCPSSSESAGTLISTPASWSLAKRSTCFMPNAFLACVTRAPTRFRSPSASFLVFKRHRPHFYTNYI